jgi:hypothetical protein
MLPSAVKTFASINMTVSTFVQAHGKSRKHPTRLTLQNCHTTIN